MDLDFTDYAIDRQNNRAYFLQRSANAVQKFNTLTGDFVETLNYNQGPISAISITEGKLVVVFKTSVWVGALEQAVAQTGRKFSEKTTLVDANLRSVLHEKQSSWCVSSLNKPKDKEADKESCVRREKTRYLHSSSSGFWFFNEHEQTVVHVAPAGQTNLKVSAASQDVLAATSVADFVLVRSANGLAALFAGETAIESTNLADYSTCNYSSVPLVGAQKAACVTKASATDRIAVKAVPVSKAGAKTITLATLALSGAAIEAFWPSAGAEEASWVTVLSSQGDITILNERGNSVWTKSTDFGQIVDLLVAEYHSAQESDDIPRYESFGVNFVGAFLYRVFTDLNDLKNLAITAVPKIAANLNLNRLIEKIKGNTETVLEDISYYNRYGLRKNLIFVTSTNKLLSLDSLSGAQGWSISLKPGQTIVKSFVNDQNNINLIYSDKGTKYLTEISSADGTFVAESRQLDTKASVFYVNENSNGLAAINFREHAVSNLDQEYSYYKVGKQGVTGFVRSAAGKFEEVWNYVFEPGQTLLGYSYHLKGDTNYLSKLKQGSLVTLPEEEALYYKVVDSGNIGLVIKHTVNGADSVVITLLNTVRGKVLGTYQHTDIDFKQPVVYLYDDNGFFLSYYNPKMMNFELWTIEIYRRKVETSFIDM